MGLPKLDERYSLEEVIGEGGMGSVYRGVQHSMNRSVAVKVIDPDDTRKPDTVLRFLREAKLVSKLNHPNIVPVYDFGETEEGLLYLVMEHIEGATLGDVLEAGPLPLSRVVAIASQICDALEAAHAQAIVHRDLKPANIMVVTSRSGRDFVRLLDFGIARSLGPQDVITKERGFVGTPGYIAPEAARTGDFDQRSDIYSLGVLLYEMIAGRLPYDDIDNVPMLLQHVANGDVNPLPEEIPAAATNVIMRMLAHDPDERYADAATVRLALEAAASEAGEVPAVPAPLPPRVTGKLRTETVEPPSGVTRPGGDMRLALVAAGVLVVAILLLLVARWRAEPDGLNEIERAQEEAARELMEEEDSN